MTDNNNNEIKNATNHTNKASSKKNKYSDNFNSVINNLSAESPTSHNKPWYKKTGSVVAMSSTLGVGVLATVIAVPLVLTTNNGPGISKDEIVKSPIEKFNEQTPTKKIEDYNKMVAENNNAILTYIKGVGMGYFYDENAAPISTTVIPNNGNSPKVFANFRKLLNSSALFTGNENQFNQNFLSVKGIASQASTLYANLNYDSTYCSSYNNSISTNASNIPTYNFFSPIKKSIQDVKINENSPGVFSITMNLIDPSTNALFYLIDHSVHNNSTPHFASYKPVITFNDKTLFPGMSEYIKTVLLK
ncbi:MAG: hypothetical protein RSC02_00305 [Malacoplasma sp.]